MNCIVYEDCRDACCRRRRTIETAVSKISSGNERIKRRGKLFLFFQTNQSERTREREERTRKRKEPPGNCPRESEHVDEGSRNEPADLRRKEIILHGCNEKNRPSQGSCLILDNFIVQFVAIIHLFFFFTLFFVRFDFAKSWLRNNFTMSGGILL